MGNTEGELEMEVVALGDEEVDMKVEVVLMTRTHPGSRDPREHLPGL